MVMRTAPRIRSATSRWTLTVIAWVLAAATMSAQNWPQWRGPSGHAISTEQRLPVTWDVKRNVAWRASLAGLGTSSPIVWGDRVFVTSQIGATDVAGGGA